MRPSSFRGERRKAVLTLEIGNKRKPIPFQFVDKGHGKFRFDMGGKRPWAPGNYKMGEGSVVLTFLSGPKRDREIVIALKRVKFAK